MSYFDQLPDVYIGEGVKDEESFKYRLVKNIFRRVRIRPDIQSVAASFETYELMDDQTPTSLSWDLYGSVDYDWIIPYYQFDKFIMMSGAHLDYSLH